MKRGSIVFGVVIGAASLLMTGCPPRMRIAEINRDPGRYFNREVTVVGRVTRSYGALGQGVYEIDDGTGRMWVLTEKYGVPGKDAYVGVTGKVYPGLTASINQIAHSKRYAGTLPTSDQRFSPIRPNDGNVPSGCESTDEVRKDTDC